MVNMVSGYCDGTCVVTARVDDGQTRVPMPSEDEDSLFYQVDHVFRIDKTGKVLEETDMAAFQAQEEAMLAAHGQRSEIQKKQEGSFYTQSVQLADGLTLSVANPLQAGEITSLAEVGGYELTDANGNQYPLEDYDVRRAVVTDDGRVFVLLQPAGAGGRGNFLRPVRALPGRPPRWQTLPGTPGPTRRSACWNMSGSPHRTTSCPPARRPT